MNFTRSKKIDRAQVMQKAIQAHQLTKDGADWLTLRLDPYHDFNRPISGYPDADAYDTIVSVQNYETNISAPAAATWDAHIFTMPFTTGTFNNGTIDAIGDFVQGADSYNLGIVNVATDVAGGPLFPTANPVASATFTCAPVDNFAGVESGISRIIGLGIEVIDTTAVLNKQGALTAYKMPVTIDQKAQMGVLNAAGTIQWQGQFTTMPTPPSTVAEAVLFRTSVQWEAKDGCYMTVGQQGVNNPLTRETKQGVRLGDGAAGQALSTNIVSSTVAQAAPIITAGYPQSTLKLVNMTQSGVFLKGLAAEATFKIRVRVYVERAPDRTDTDLIPLATPSAPYDMQALALYSQLVTELPLAVPVSFNAKGDWWRIIVNALKSILPIAGTVLTPILGPEAGMIGSAVGAMIPRQKVGKKNTKRAQSGW